MQVNKKMIHLPPYLSTSWKNISALFVEEKEGKPLLKVALNSGKEVEIPNLDKASLEAIFKAHAEALKESETPSQSLIPGNDSMIGFKIPLNIGDQMANFGEMMQHNSDQIHAPPMPKEILKKISDIAQAVGMTPEVFPKPEPHCNCPHCQIARAIHQDIDQDQGEEEEIVSDEDLRFREWDIQQTNNQLYLVSNPLNKKEHYNVFLGKPLGCTCGEKNCEHLRAVLRS